MGRYLAILAIIALGVGFFSGLKVTKPGMVETGNKYLREHNFYDFRLLSSIGFDADAVEKMRKQEHVLAADGSYYEDMIYEDADGKEKVLRAQSITEHVNTLELRDGRMPEADDECVVDAYQFKGQDIIGQEIEIADSNTQDTKDAFAHKKYKVVGTVNSPIYINIERGTTDLGNGRISAFIFIPEGGFSFDAYKEIYVQSQDSYDIYTDAYDDFIDDVTPDMETALKAVTDDRYDRLVTDLGRTLVEDAVEKQQQELQAMMQDAQSGTLTQEQIAQMEQLQPLTQEQQDALVQEYGEQAAKKAFGDVKTYVLDRSTNVGYMCYDNDTNIVDGVAKVFPIFFFLIAALVCSTTMTRMVDDERGQIGTYRALGYTNGRIMAKYLIYSGSSAFLGCVIGFFVGSYLFPYVISEAYKMLYDFGTGIDFYFSPGLLVICLIVSLLCSMGTAFLACINELRCMPAELIRPKAPAAGKRILLERIPFIWKPMKFLHKVTARNVFRFKKRMFMMLLGIAGCTALVLTGLGAKDSVSNLAEFQYGDIDTYDMEVTLNGTYNEDIQQEVEDAVGDGFEDSTAILKSTVEYHAASAIKTVYLIAAEPEDLESFVKFDMTTSNGTYPGNGEVMLSKKIAEIADVTVGDPITLHDTDAGDVTLTVSGIFENYVWHYAYITPECYEQYFDKACEANTMYLHVDTDSTAYEAGGKLSALSNVMSVSVVADIKDRVENMMKMMDAVVGLVIGSAGALAFIVLFNLSNINITERVREIATIKVLGFYPRETGSYVFRENFILTLMGIVVGLPLGCLLHRFVMSQIQVDMVAFATRIMNISYLYSVLIVLAFLIIVDLVMRRKIDKIDMAESLKSIE